MAYSPKNPNGQETMANSEPVVIASDQSSIPVTPTNQYTEDAVADANPTGPMMMAVARSGIAGEVASGDNVALRADIAGRLYVSDEDGTLFLQTLAETAQLNSTPAILGSNRGYGTMALRTATPIDQSDANNDWEFLQMKDGRLWTSAKIDTALPAGNNNIGDVDIASMPNVTLAASTNNIGDVDVLTMPAVAGAAAQNAAISGNPVPVGLRASTGTPFPVSADGNVVYGWATRNGAQVIAGEKVDDAPFTVGTDRVAPVGLMADEVSTDSVDEGDVGIPRMTLDRKQIVALGPHTAGGLSTFHLVSAASTNATVVKASAGQVFGWFIYNSNAAARKVVFHNTASTPTAGASVFFTLVIPPNSGANVEMTNGITFSTGIAITTVTGLADNDNTAVAVNDLNINIFYK